MNLAYNLENSTRFFPNKPAIREGELELTYSQFNDQVNRVATGLIKLGIKPGDLIGLCAPNSTDWLIFYFGVIKAGAVAVTLFSTMTSGELNNLLNHAGPKMLFTTPDRLNDLEHLKASGMLEKIFCSKESEMTLKDLIETGSGSFKALDMQREDIGAILYTGGTTGVPKGCMLTHEHLMFSSHSIAYYEHSSPNDFALCLNPFNHVFGQLHIMNPTFYSAGCLEIPKANDTESILRITESGRVTKFFQVPTVYVRLLKVPDLKKRLGNISYCFSGGASMAREVVRQWKEITGITIAESHGMTEFMPITFNHYYPEQHVIGSVGQPACGVEVQIRHISSGEILDIGDEGEICVRGRNIMKGYLNNPEATKEIFWEDGWMRTGDIGVFDENNFLYIVDRIKELIVTGGENVFPREVEESLFTISEVDECAVIGLPDREWGERVTAFIKPKAGKAIEKDKVKAYLKTKLAPFKVPKEYIIVDELPKTPAGKIMKREIKKNYLQSHK